MQQAEVGEYTGQVACDPALLAGSKEIHHPESKHLPSPISNRNIRRLEAPLSRCKQRAATRPNSNKTRLRANRVDGIPFARTGSPSAQMPARVDAHSAAVFFAIMGSPKFLARHLEAMVI